MRKFKLTDAVCSDVGKKRKENQDSFAFVHSKFASLYIVADGMGGSLGGATASACAVNIVSRESFVNGLITEESIRKAIVKANAEIYSQSLKDSSLAGMGTTIVVLGIIGEKLLVGHVGDSRIYRLRDGELSQLTRDHSLIRELVDSGAVKEDEAENHPVSHMLTRSLGPSEEVKAEVAFHPVSLAAGEQFLLCSDGLYNLVKNQEIADILKKNTPENSCQQLLELALERGGTDNVTIEIIKIHALEEEVDGVLFPEGDALDVFVSSEVTFDEDEQEEQDEKEEILSPLNQIIFSDKPSGKDAVKTKKKKTEKPEKKVEEEEAREVERPHLEAVDVVEQGKPSSAFGPKPEMVLFLVSVFFSAIAVFYFLTGKESTSLASKESKELSATAKLEQELRKESIKQAASKKKDIEHEAKEALVENLSEQKHAEVVGEVPTEVGEQENTIYEQTEEVIAKILDVSLGPIPSVVLESGNVVVDQPIDWEDEKIAVNKFFEEVGEQVSNDTSATTLLSEEEKAELSQEKLELRETIFEADSKLRFLVLKSRDEILQAISSFNEKIKLLDFALKKLSIEISAIKGAYDRWKDFDAAEDKEILLAAGRELSSEFDSLRTRVEQFEKTSFDYVDAVEKWQSHKDDPKHIAEMAAKSRNYQTSLVALQESVRTIVAHKQAQLKEDYADAALRRFFLEKKKNRLNRHIGMLTALIPDSLEIKREKLKLLTSEREALTNHYGELLSKLPDNEELELRRRTFAETLDG